MVFLAKHPMVSNYDLSSMRELLCAAAPCSEQLENEVRVRLDNPKLRFRQGQLTMKTLPNYLNILRFGLVLLNLSTKADMLRYVIRDTVTC